MFPWFCHPNCPLLVTRVTMMMMTKLGTGGPIKRMNFRKNSKRGGSFPIPKFISQMLDFYIGPFYQRFPKRNCNIISEMREGVHGRLEFFRKFIRFGSTTLPLLCFGLLFFHIERSKGQVKNYFILFFHKTEEVAVGCLVMCFLRLVERALE